MFMAFDALIVEETALPCMVLLLYDEPDAFFLGFVSDLLNESVR